MTLGHGDANSKLVEVLTVADDEAEERVDDILVQIWKLKSKLDVCSDQPTDRAQDLFKILKLRVSRDFEAAVWLVFCF